MAVIGKVSIKVYPDTDGFGRTTRASIERQLAREKPKVEVIPDVDPDALDDELRDAVWVVKGRVRAQPNRYKVTVPVDVDYEVDEDELDRELNRAISNPKDQRVTRKIHVDTDVDDDRARAMADKVLDGTQRGIDKRDPLAANLTPELDREKLNKALRDLEDARRESSERQAKQNLDAWQSKLYDAAGDDDLHPWFGDGKRRLEAAKRLGEAYRKEYEDGWRKAAYNRKQRADLLLYSGVDLGNDYYSKFSFHDEAFHDAWKDYEADRSKWSAALDRQLDEMHEKTREAIGDGIRTGLTDAARHLDDWQAEAFDASGGKWDWEHPWLDDPKRGLEAARRLGAEYQEEYTKGWTASRRSGGHEGAYERYNDRPDAFHAGWLDFASDYAKWTAPLREALHKIQYQATSDGVKDGLKKAKTTQRKGLTELLDEARATMDSEERENPIFSRTISPVFGRDEANKLSRAMRTRMKEQPDIPVRTSSDLSPLTDSLSRELRRREFMIRLGIDDDAIDRMEQKLRERKLRIDVDLDDKALNRLKGRLADRRLKVKVDVDDEALDKLNARTKGLKDHNIKVGLGLRKGAAAKLLAEATAAVKKVEKALPKLRAPLRLDARVDESSLTRAMSGLSRDPSGLKWGPIPVIPEVDKEELHKTLQDVDREVSKVLVRRRFRRRLEGDELRRRVEEDLFDPRRKSLHPLEQPVKLVTTGDRFFETLRSNMRAKKLQQKVELDVDRERFADKVKSLASELKAGFRSVGGSLERPFRRSMCSIERMGLRTASRLKSAFSEATSVGGGTFFEGLRRMSGMRLARNLAEDTWEPLSNFDIHMPKMLTMSAILNQAAAAVGSLTSNLLALGRDVARILPGALALPGAFISLGVGALSAAFGLKDLGKVMPQVAETFKAIPEVASRAFWNGAREGSSELQRNLRSLGEAFQEGFAVSSAAAGKWFAAWTDDVNQFLTPALGSMFQGVADAFKELEAGGEGFAKILAELGGLGARFAPDMSRWLADGMNTFGNWLEKKRLTGELDQMVKTAWEKTKDLGAIVRETYGFLDRLSAIAERAGGASLRNLADGIERMNRALDRPEVAITVERMFKAAHETTKAFGSAIKGGLGDFLTMVGEIASDFGPKIGGTAGGLLGGLLEGLASPAMANSLRNFATEFEKLGDIIRPVLVQSGEVAGILDTINAAIVPFGKLGAVAVGGVLDLIDDLGPSLAKAVESLGNGAVDLAGAMFGPLTEAVAGIGPQIASLGDDFGTFMSRLSGPMKEALTGVKPMLSDIADGIVAVVDPLLDGLGTAAQHLGGPLRDAFEQLGDLVKRLGTSIQNELMGVDWDSVGAQIGKLVNGAMELIGLLDQAAGKLSDEVEKEEIVALMHGREVRANPGQLNQSPAGNVLGRLDAWGAGYLDMWGGITDEGQRRLDHLLAIRDEYAKLKPPEALELEVEAQQVEDAREKLKQLEASYLDLERLTSKGLEADLSKLLTGVNNAIPSIEKMWNVLGADGQAHAATLSSAMGQVQTALDMTGVSMGDFANKNSDAWKRVQQEGGAKLEAMETAYAGFRAALKETGVTAENIRAALAMPGLDAAARAELHGLLSILEDVEGRGDLAGIALKDLGYDITNLPPGKTIELEIDGKRVYATMDELGRLTVHPTAEVAAQAAGAYSALDSLGREVVRPSVEPKFKSLSYDDIMANIYAGSSPTSGLIAGIQIPVNPKVDTAQIPAALAGVQAGVQVTPKVDTAQIPAALAGVQAGVQVTPQLNSGAVAGLMAGVSALQPPPLSVDVQVTPGAAVAIGGVTGAVQTLRANIGAGVGAGALNASLSGFAGPASTAVNSLGNVGTKAIDTAGKVNQASGQSSNAMSNMARNTSSHAQNIAGSLTGVSSQVGQMANAVASGGSRAVGSMRSTASGIRGAVANVSLHSAGAAIGASLVRGLNSQRGAVAGAARGLGATIKANKGPIEKDRVMLVPEGIAIVEGLVAGLRDAEGRLLLPAVREITSDLRAEATFTSFGERLGEAIGTGMDGALQDALKDAKQTAVRGLDGVSSDLTHRKLSDGDAMIADLMKFMAPVLEMEKHAGNLLNGQGSMVSSTPMQTASGSGASVEINNYWAKDDDTATATAKSAHLATLYLG